MVLEAKRKNRISGWCLLAMVTLLQNQQLVAEDATTIRIPLNRVYSLAMPDTQLLGTAFKAFQKEPATESRPSGLEILRQTLATRKPTSRAMEGFAVNASSIARARTWATSAIRKNNSPTKPLASEIDSYLVFFSYASAYKIEIVDILRTHQTFRVSYRFAPTYSIEPVVHLAFIPVGKLLPDNYHVQYQRLPLSKKLLEAGFTDVSDRQAQRLVSSSFSFSVSAQPSTPKALGSLIPLDTIWGDHMPGTRDVQKLESEIFFTDHSEKAVDEQVRILNDSRTMQIRQALQPADNQLPQPLQQGFAVQGENLDALKQAHQVLVDGQAPQKTFFTNEPITLCFFSLQSGTYVHITSVEQRENAINIRYHFQPHYNSAMSEHFALIPISQITPGQVRVNVTQEPNPQLQQEWGKKLVCRSFSFEVKQP